MKKIILTFLFSQYLFIINAQSSFYHQYLNNQEPEHGSGLCRSIECKNGDKFLVDPISLVGTPTSYCVTSALRIDDNGNVIWNTALTMELSSNQVTSLEDNFGNLYIFGVNGLSASIVKLSANGNFLWSKNYGYYSEFVDAILLNSGEIIAIGGIINKSKQFSNAYMVKIDQKGEIQWEKMIDFPGQSFATSILSLESGIFLVVGDRDADLESNFKGGHFGLKLNTDGTITWLKSYGFGLLSGSMSVLKTGPDSYTIFGGTYQMVLLCIDGLGDFQFSKRLKYNTANAFLPTTAFVDNDDLIIGGILATNNIYSGFLLSISKTIKVNWISFYLPDWFAIGKITKNSSSGYVLTGVREIKSKPLTIVPFVMQTDSMGQIPCISELDFNPPIEVLDFPVLVDSGATITTLNNIALVYTPIIKTDIIYTKKVICESNATQNIHNNASPLFTLYPNPASSEVTIELTPEYQIYGSKLQIEISDALGRKVLGVPVSHYENLVVPKGILSSGYYVVSVVSQGKVLQSQKLVEVE